MPGRDDLPLAFDRADALAAGHSRHEFQRLAHGRDVITVAPRTHAVAVAWLLAARVDRHLALSRIAAVRDAGAGLSASRSSWPSASATPSRPGRCAPSCPAPRAATSSTTATVRADSSYR